MIMVGGPHQLLKQIVLAIDRELNHLADNIGQGGAMLQQLIVQESFRLPLEVVQPGGVVHAAVSNVVRNGEVMKPGGLVRRAGTKVDWDWLSMRLARLLQLPRLEKHGQSLGGPGLANLISRRSVRKQSSKDER